MSGLTRLAGPTLILYEVNNAVVQAVQRGCVTNQDGEAILAAFEGLGIEMKPVDWQQMLPLAPRFDRSASDAAYLVLAKEQGEPLITGYLRLYQAVRDHLDWVRWIGDS